MLIRGRLIERFALLSLAILCLLAATICSIEIIWRINWGDASISPPIFQRAQMPLAYSLRPHATATARQFDRSVTITTTSSGTRTVVGTPAAAPFRVHLVGDSQIFGWGLSDEETVASRLQAALGDNAVVINNGVPGYGPTQYRLLLATFPVEDIVIVFHTEENDAADAYNIAIPNEVSCGFLVTIVRTESTAICAIMRLPTAQLVLAYINDFVHRYAMTPLGFSDYSEVAGSVLHYRMTKLYEAEQKLRRDQLLFSVVPWKGRYSREWLSRYAPPPKDDVAFIASPFSDRLGMVDMMRVRSGMYIDGDAHLSPAGAELIAGLLAEALRERMHRSDKGGSP